MMIFAGWSCVLASLVTAVAGQAESRQLATFNPMTAVAAPPVASPTGGGISGVTNAAINGDKAKMKLLTAGAIDEIPTASGQFVQGFIAAYFQRVTLEPGEKACIERNIHSMVSDSAAVLTTVGIVIADLVEQKNPPAWKIVSAGMQVIKIVQSVQDLVRGCVQADAIAVMNSTLHHLQNPIYVKGRLLANGIDIAKCVAAAIPAYEAENFQGVGRQFGTLMRKILLSRNSGTVEMVLPEGLPKNEVGETIVNGIIEGLFVEGASVDMVSKKDATVAVHVDLHKCIAEEAPYFSAAMNALYLAIAQITTNLEQWQLQKKGIKTGYVVQSNQNYGTPEPGTNYGVNGHVLRPSLIGGLAPNMDWMNRLSKVMSNIPTLMDRCGMTPEQSAMMSKALKTMNDMSLTFNIPGPKDRVQAGNKAAVKIAEATDQWQDGHYHSFGFLLGGLMRDLLLTMFPQQYHMDHGELRAYVESVQSKDIADNSRVGSFALIVGGFSGVMFLGLSIFRMVRHRGAAAKDPLIEVGRSIDVEHAVE